MIENVPRPLLVLTAIIVLVALSIGIKDYLQGKEANATASTSPAVHMDSGATGKPKQTDSANIRHARTSATEPFASTTRRAGGNENGEPIIDSSVLKKTARTPQVTAAQLGAVDQNASDELDTTTAEPTSTPFCVPLPNGTRPIDADAPYYENWATEYSCVFPARDARRRPNPQLNTR